MFIVFNREKLKSYIILLSTVLVLLFVAFGLKNDKTMETNANTLANSENIIEKNNIN